MPDFAVNLPIKKAIQVRRDTVPEIRSHVEQQFDDKPTLRVDDFYPDLDFPDGIIIDDVGFSDGDYAVILDVGDNGVAVARYTEEEFFAMQTGGY